MKHGIGSLSLQWVSGTYDYGVAYSPGEQGNAAFLSALENASTLTFDYTTPPAGTGNYFGLGIVVNAQQAGLTSCFLPAPRRLAVASHRQQSTGVQRPRRLPPSRLPTAGALVIFSSVSFLILTIPPPALRSTWIISRSRPRRNRRPSPWRVWAGPACSCSAAASPSRNFLSDFASTPPGISRVGVFAWTVP